MNTETTSQKVPVARRSLMARINRQLAKTGRQVKSNKLGTSLADRLGRHYVLDIDAGQVTATHVDLEALGREMGVMDDWEALEG
jgi:hypothetical protein